MNRKDLIKQCFLDDITEKKVKLLTMLPKSINIDKDSFHPYENYDYIINHYDVIPNTFYVVSDIVFRQLLSEIEEDIAKYHTYLAINENILNNELDKEID